jgi:uncharacterized protein (DUF58 family)
MARTPAEHESQRRLRRAAEEAAAAFPALLVEAARVAQTVATGLHGRRRAGPGETFWQHRPYSFGDPVSAVDWRQSARAADRLYVRQNEWESAAAVWIRRDVSQSLAYASAKEIPTKRWRADVIAVALAILLAEAGERIGLLGVHPRPFAGQTAPTRILEAILSAPTGAEDDEVLRHAPQSGARIVWISDFLFARETVDAGIRGFAAAGVEGLAVMIADPAEEDFPFGGRTEFADLESSARLLFGKAETLGERYRRRYLAHRAAVAETAGRYGWRFIAHRTDRAAHLALLALYAALSDPNRSRRAFPA